MTGSQRGLWLETRECFRPACFGINDASNLDEVHADESLKSQDRSEMLRRVFEKQESCVCVGRQIKFKEWDDQCCKK